MLWIWYAMQKYIAKLIWADAAVKRCMPCLPYPSPPPFVRSCTMPSAVMAWSRWFQTHFRGHVFSWKGTLHILWMKRGDAPSQGVQEIIYHTEISLSNLNIQGDFFAQISPTLETRDWTFLPDNTSPSCGGTYPNKALGCKLTPSLSQ